MDLCLLPMPRTMSVGSECCVVSDATIVVPAAPSADTLYAAELLQAGMLHYLIHRPAIATVPLTAQTVQLVLDPTGLSAQGYTLGIRTDGITLRGADESGLFYAVQTLIQIIRQKGTTLPSVEIEDFPDFPNRGVMLDISRDKVPKIQTLFNLVDMLSEWKINQIQLYMEHTFAYRNHPEVWATASPITHEEILLLDEHCRKRHVQLVPNQNSFGHMERWLRLPKYIDLAEAPEGSESPWNFRWQGPFSLCPTDPRSLELISGLYEELLPHFSSRLFNVGCDETFDVGQGRSKSAVEAKGKTRVYFDFLQQLHKLVQSHGRTMMFWGDIILHEPQIIAELPKDIIALEWGYDGEHPFDKDGEQFAQAGVPFYVCPGTSSWCTLVGRTENCLQNQASAAENGKKHGAIGYLNTDWGDHGHLQYLPVSYLGFAAGAAYSWGLPANRELDLTRALSLHAFHDAAGIMGRIAYDLGTVCKRHGLCGYHTRLFKLLLNLKDDASTPDITMEQLDGAIASIDAIMSDLHKARMDHPDASLILSEFANGAAMLRHAGRRGKWTIERGCDKVTDLTEDLRLIIGKHESLWLSRNRPGGLADSANRLRNTLGTYNPS
jgi:hexosaminidase